MTLTQTVSGVEVVANPTDGNRRPRISIDSSVATVGSFSVTYSATLSNAGKDVSGTFTLLVYPKTVFSTAYIN